jgi:N-glycosidase YbiA
VVFIWGERFPTAEHAYQASRIVPGPERESIKNALSPLEAWRIGQKYKNNPEFFVKGFDKDAVMEEIFRAKMDQHQDIEDVLKESGTRVLEKRIDSDYYWGTGNDGSGENRRGKLWMKLREELAID